MMMNNGDDYQDDTACDLTKLVYLAIAVSMWCSLQALPTSACGSFSGLA
jgi:hypothetical protein